MVGRIRGSAMRCVRYSFLATVLIVSGRSGTAWNRPLRVCASSVPRRYLVALISASRLQVMSVPATQRGLVGSGCEKPPLTSRAW